MLYWDYSDNVIYQYSITPGLCPFGVGSGIGNDDDGPSSSLTSTDNSLRGMTIRLRWKICLYGSSADRIGHYKMEIPWDDKYFNVYW